ncbi:MAG: outer membrane protein assembly factor BamA [Deltaproteobacteria bacterium]|nr:outer membrane protein assembly factor BamA [Deltaproteobacteria bacterium]
MTRKRSLITHLVDLTYYISKGSKVRFERINITGNTITRDKVIRRELEAIEGEDFSGGALKTSTENLKRLGFFEDVEMVPKKGSRDDLMVLDVKVTEKPTGSFSLGAGYSSEDSVFTMFQVAQSNLYGRGQTLQASAKLGGLSSEFNITFTEPWLFDTRYSGTFNIYRWKQEYEDYSFQGSSIESYKRNSYGGRIGIGFPMNYLIDYFDELTRGTVSYSHDNSDISNVPIDASAAWKDMEGENITSSITLSMRRDSRDEPWNTSTGSVNSLSFEYAGGVLGGSVYYNKYRASSAWYFPLFWKTVFLLRGNWGYVDRRSGGKLPVYQKFRIGGINSVRGFDYGHISPRDPITGDFIGGGKMMYYNFEYRVPLLKGQGIVGLVFYDTGNVWEEDDNYSFSDMRESVGAGIRWYSPMGPLRLEYGKNLDPQFDEETGKWEFSIGGLF